MALSPASGGYDVSVVIPTHNGERFLSRAIDSALGQRRPPLEVIVVDDGSTDGTPALLAGYGSRIRSLRLEHGERSRARNAGIAAAQGEWIAFLDADDEWLPAKLERQMAALAAQPEAVLAYTTAENIDDVGDPVVFGGSRWVGVCDGRVECRSHRAELLFGCTVTAGGSTAVVRRRVLVAAGGFEPALRFGEDWDLWLRLSQAAAPFVGLGEVLARRRTHGRRREIAIQASDELLYQRRLMFQRLRERGQCPSTATCDTAEAAEILRTAMARFELGDVPAGREAARLAWSLDSKLRTRDRLLAELEVYARAVWYDSGRLDEAVRDFLENAVTGLAEAHGLGQRSVHAIMARLKIARAFRGATPRLRRQEALAALRHDPRWLLNRGVLSILATPPWR